MATREQIQEYLDIRDIIDKRVNAVLNENLSIDTIPEGEEKNMIELTVETVEKKNEYLHEKVLYEAAIYDYRVTEHSNPNAIKKVAAKYKLELMSLRRQIYKHTRTDSNYVFDKDIEGDYISYAQEETLWQYLKWVSGHLYLCSCRVCFLLESSLFACIFYRPWEIDNRYLQCLGKAASIEWIKKFEMMHRDEIYNLCKNKTCSVASVEPVCSISTSNQ